MKSVVSGLREAGFGLLLVFLALGMPMSTYTLLKSVNSLTRGESIVKRDEYAPRTEVGQLLANLLTLGIQGGGSWLIIRRWNKMKQEEN
jgi:hypothetical protein